MKAIVNILIAALVTVTLPSCKKDIALENETLIGKWRQVQIFSGHVNNGNYAWATKPSFTDMMIEFLPNGQFNQTIGSGENLKNYSGTYNIHSGNKLVLTSSNQPNNQAFVISQQTGSGLIIDHPVKEGVVRERFMRVYNY